LFDGTRATGVLAVRDGEMVEFLGSETILCAGSVFSPPILMRSGIGVAGDLMALGIDVVADLPVGQNLCDHSSVGIHLQLRPEAKATSWDDRLLICYIRYSSRMAGAGDNDMVIASRNLNGYNEDGLSAGAISVITWQNFSRGEMKLLDSDPLSMPLIDQDMLSDERDLVRLRDGARRIFEIGRHPAIQSISEGVSLSRGVTVSIPMTIDDVQDDKALDEWMMLAVRDTWHLVGTCRMGAAGDPRSVVDPDCRVLGVQGLRVIDGSIMPEVPRANTNLTCMTIAEHMAPRLLRQR
jgi:5-(hydroxymethyl)furfural/furfural oxidase